MEYTVATLREAGLEAKWHRTRKGAPIIVARGPRAYTSHQREGWWAVDKSMWKRMGEVGIMQGFEESTLLGDIFSIPL